MIRQSVGKIDGMAACLGKPLYVEDICPADCLKIKLLRSPYAFAEIINIDTSAALKLPGVACVLTYQDVPQKPITFAAEAAPEGSTHDRTIIERIMRYVGEPAAAVAAETEEIAQAALKLIRVDYRVLQPNLNYEASIDNGNPIYAPEQVTTHFDNGSDPARNIIARKSGVYGDVDGIMRNCDVVVESTSYTQAQAHAMAETHRTFCNMDMRGKLVVYSSCQSVFNTQRIISEGLGLPFNKLRVVKPKVGGAFGGKNTTFFEGLVAAVTWKTSRPSLLVLDRNECFAATNTRHASRVCVRVGADTSGVMRAMDVDMLINGGAHGEHSFDVLCVGCNNSIPIYQKGEALRFNGRAAYTNMVPAGAYRGFGGPQVAFAIEGAVSELSYRLGMDPSEVRLKNIIHEGDDHPFVSGGVVQSCALDRLIIRGRELIGWNEKYPCRRMDDHTIRAVGMSIAMHGSGIGGLDHVNATISLNYNGSFTLFVGACDLGTGADTILLQIAAQALDTSVENINILVSDTDLTPYDKGAYASSTTYVTGNAVKAACEQMMEKMRKEAAAMYQAEPEDVVIEADEIFKASGGRIDSVESFAQKVGGNSGPAQLTCTAGFSCKVSPPPYVAGFVELDVDTETGGVRLLNYAAVADCGTVMNPNLARIQMEGGCVQCMGYALYEDVKYSSDGVMQTDDFLKYRIPTCMDVPDMQIEFIQSYEPTGPYGAKSIGEVAFHTPAAAIREALLHATGVSFPSLPFTPEKILCGILAHLDAGGRLPC